MQKVVEVGHFKKSENIRIICDASKTALGAVLQKQDKIGWRPIHFASGFLTALGKKFHKRIGTTCCRMGNRTFQELRIWNKIPSSVRP